MIQCKKYRKVVLSLSTFICTLFSLSSCGESKFLDKPEETNLEFWITEEVSDDQFLNCTFLPGLFGGDMYLDSRYKAVFSDGSTMAQAPDVHVVYTISAYPDYSNSESYVTGIDITDSNINVYGLTMNSSDEDISKTMARLGFSNSENNNWSKNNCVFTFKESGINIGAKVTNNKGIIY